jgi:hypothetical protein
MGKKQIREGQDPAQAWAEKLVADIRAGFITTQDRIVEFIRADGWTTLGYETFEKFWTERLSDIALATAVLPHVVYQLFAEGLDDDQVADIVAGVGPATAAALRRQRDNGVPAGRVTKQTKRKRLPIETWFIPMPIRESRELKRKAQRAGLRYADIAREAIRDKFAEMD